MKAEIKNDNKAKFFAIYYDQVVLFQASFVKGDDLKSILNNKEQDRYGESAYLRLKQLSSISDEDAIKCFEIFVGAVELEEFKIKWIKDNIEIVIGNSNISDYLRSKGYALPYMGLPVDEMIEAGWIKLIDK